jgi:diphthamide synthase (EF-2-diphthine--ammonia ligase)
MKEPLLVAWSSGKDSTLALQKILETDNYLITLRTTVTEGYERISMHGVRERLLQIQAKSLGLPIDTVHIPQECSDEEYRRRMGSAMLGYYASGGGPLRRKGGVSQLSVRWPDLFTAGAI